MCHLNIPIGAVVYRSAGGLFGEGRGPIFLAHLACTGIETNLLHCRNSVFFDSYCTHNYDAGVKCEGQ